MRARRVTLPTLTAALLVASAASAQVADQCHFTDVPGAVSWGTSSQMTMVDLAAHVAPVYWFSPDEPLLRGAVAEEIMLPQGLPFEPAPDGPVVYYQVEELVYASAELLGERNVAAADAPFTRASNPNNSIVDFRQVVTFKISYFAYFESEVGVGAHEHDLEATEFKVVILRSDGEYLAENSAAQCDEPTYVIIVTRVSAKAHGIRWFWNVVDVDEDTRFPMFLFVEEGKHASRRTRTATATSRRVTTSRATPTTPGG